MPNFLKTSLIVITGLVAIARTASADPSIRILLPSDDNCAAYVEAINSGDRVGMLSLGGWALGFWSALAEQSGKDIFHNTTSEALLDKLATECQAQPNTPMSSLVEAIGRDLVAQAP